MLFYPKEKVFSLARTADAVPRDDISLLFAEFYCYLLVAGLYREGEGVLGVHWNVPRLSHDQFAIPSGSYNAGIGDLLGKGLKLRYKALYYHPHLSDHERSMLDQLDGIFTADRQSYVQLSARDILGVAYRRNFSPDMCCVARYTAVAFGQRDFPTPFSLPRLYLSVFGNIHLAKRDPAQESGPTNDTVTLDVPFLVYGTVNQQGDNVTALWAILSAMTDTLSRVDHYPITAPGNYLGDILSSWAFLNDKGDFEKTIPVPSFAQTLYVKALMGLDNANPVSISAMFYSEFLYKTTDTLKVSRSSLLNIILDLMMKKMGETRLDHLFTSNSFYRKLATTSTIYGTAPKRPAILQFALEALDPDMDKPDGSDDNAAPLKNKTDVTTPPDASEDPETDPLVEDGGYDPSTPPPAAPAADPYMDKDTIGLISFDKSGEGVDEDLYRAAVVALNKRLRSDDTLPISSETKDILNYWVNGWIYRTAISATKDQIKQLNLQKYLKTVSI